jgi:bifunctional non-homologous end joining protein LigD
MSPPDTLDVYRSKRDFTKTSEPSGTSRRGRSKAAGGRFVIHKHDARRLHYDLRLEHEGVLWSWAVTRGPSLDPSEKRLAVHVEDHPLDYGDFEGNIPEGEYGAGSVIVWDKGTWSPEGDPAAGLKKGHLSFTLKGSKLSGAWHLVRLKPRRGEKRDNWLLIKVDDTEARPGSDILEEQPKSVVSGRTNDDVAADRKAAVWDTSEAHPKPKPDKARGRAKSAKTSAATAATPPEFIAPQLATLMSDPPAGGTWLHEVKFDGYRIQAHLMDGKVRLLTRTGLDWTEKFGDDIPAALRELDCGTAVIDGEIVVLGGDGVASFPALQAALSDGDPSGMLFYAFDLLWLDGDDLREEALVERKAKLEALLGGDGEGPLRYSEHFHEPGKSMLRHACRMGLEGVVSKRADAPYCSGRQKAWIKSKCTNRQEFVIVGYLPSAKTGRGLRSLLVAYREKGELRYAGRVGTGFSTLQGDDLLKRLKTLKATRPPVTPTPAGQKGAIWVKPELVAEVEFRAWTAEGILRHASFQGLREDKPAEEVVQEVPEVESDSEIKPKTPRTRKRDGAQRSAAQPATSVTLSSPDKLLWPAAKVSKRGLLEHYEQVWTRMEPFVVNRPLSLVRAPDGIEGQRFFQKHASKGMHEAIGVMKDPKDGSELLFVRDFDGIAALVQLGVVEIHIWGARTETVEKPDQIVIDLDPDEGLGVEDVRAAVRDVKARLDEIGLPAFLKTSGGKGFHIVVPLKPAAGWDRVKGFAHDFAKAMADSGSERYTSTLSKKARKGRIFIDYLRNGRGSTTVAPYSARARPGATVSVPIPWDALDTATPDGCAIGSKALSSALGADDPWKGFFAAGKALKL